MEVEWRFGLGSKRRKTKCRIRVGGGETWHCYPKFKRKGLARFPQPNDAQGNRRGAMTAVQRKQNGSCLFASAQQMFFVSHVGIGWFLCGLVHDGQMAV